MKETTERTTELSHLARRFAWSVRGPRINALDEAWLLEMLTSNERDLYRSMDRTDRAHAVECALRAREALGPDPDEDVVVASALHDVGKVEAGLGTWGRVGATLIGFVVPAERLGNWRASGGTRRRVADYLAHPEIGAEMLSAAGSSELAITWAGQHHWGVAESTLSSELAKLLASADS